MEQEQYIPGEYLNSKENESQLHESVNLNEEEKQLLTIKESIPEDKDPTSKLQTRDILFNGERIGGFSYLYDNKPGGYTTFQGLEINENYRGRGMAKELYRRLNAEAQTRGEVLVSDMIVSDDAKRVWESLVRSGEVERLEGDMYAFKRPEVKKSILTS
ncbi:MAG: GNAT family N-acetyltransferase [Patescibacteria group bacterium]